MGPYRTPAPRLQAKKSLLCRLGLHKRIVLEEDDLAIFWMEQCTRCGQHTLARWHPETTLRVVVPPADLQKPWGCWVKS